MNTEIVNTEVVNTEIVNIEIVNIEIVNIEIVNIGIVNIGIVNIGIMNGGAGGATCPAVARWRPLVRYIRGSDPAKPVPSPRTTTLIIRS